MLPFWLQDLLRWCSRATASTLGRTERSGRHHSMTVSMKRLSTIHLWMLHMALTRLGTSTSTALQKALLLA